MPISEMPTADAFQGSSDQGCIFCSKIVCLLVFVEPIARLVQTMPSVQAVVIPHKSYWRDSKSALQPMLRCRHIDLVCSPNFHENGTWNGNTSACVDGYTDRMCSRCQKGFFAFGQTCYACADKWYWQLLTGGVVIVGILALMVYAYLLNSSSDDEGSLKILIFFLQGVQLLPLFGVHGTAAKAAGSLFLSIQFLGPACFHSDYDVVAQFWTMMLLPMLILVVLSVFVVGQLCCKVSGRRRSWTAFSINEADEPDHVSLDDERDKVPFQSMDGLQSQTLSWADRNIRTALVLLIFMYLPVVSAVFSMFPLDDQGFLLHAPYLSQHDAHVKFARTMAWVFVALYVVGWPAVVVILVIYARRRASAFTDFVFSCYRPNCFWWEGIVLLRRVAMSLAVALIDPTSVLLPFAVYAVYSISLLAQFICQPFRSSFDNMLENGSLFALVVCGPFVIGVFAALTSSSVVVVVAYHIAVACLIIVLISGRCFKKMRKA